MEAQRLNHLHKDTQQRRGEAEFQTLSAIKTPLILQDYDASIVKTLII